jgi:hypothetical protein
MLDSIGGQFMHENCEVLHVTLKPNVRSTDQNVVSFLEGCQFQSDDLPDTEGISTISKGRRHRQRAKSRLQGMTVLACLGIVGPGLSYNRQDEGKDIAQAMTELMRKDFPGADRPPLRQRLCALATPGAKAAAAASFFSDVGNGTTSSLPRSDLSTGTTTIKLCPASPISAIEW